MAPTVSCLLATRGRPHFLRQAIRCFRAQRMSDTELIVVDDSPDPDESVADLDERIRYVWLNRSVGLGRKLNVAATLARANVLQKLDDDDYYHPDFLAATVTAIRDQDPNAVVACSSFLVLMVRTGEVRRSGEGWFSGATLCFHRKLWERRPFRDVTRGEDWFFLQDNAPRRIRLNRPELFMAVRHGTDHAWTRCGGRSVDDVFQRRPRYPKPLRNLVPPEDLAFYERLRESTGESRPFTADR